MCFPHGPPPGVIACQASECQGCLITKYRFSGRDCTFIPMQMIDSAINTLERAGDIAALSAAFQRIV
jgi:hypothetical protein